MNCKRILPIMFIITALSACEKQQPGGSAVEGKSAIQLTLDWGETQESDIPAEYTAIFADIDTLKFNSASNLVNDLPAGDARLMLFNVPESASAEGSIISLYTSEGNVTPNVGPIYTAVSDIYLKPDALNEFAAKMTLRTKRISISVESDMPSSVSVCFNVASKMDVEYNRYFEPKLLKMDLDKQSDGVFRASAGYIGLVGETFMDFELTDSEGKSEKWTIELTAEKIGNFSELPSMLNLTVSKVEYQVGDEVKYKYVASIDSRPFDLKFVRQPYKIGDYYPDSDNPAGVVYEISEGGVRGKVVSMKNGHYNFRTTNGNSSDYAGVLDANDGMVNMNTVKGKDSNFENYPAYKWCMTLGEGWYLPAFNELQTLYDICYNKTPFTTAFTAKGGDSLGSTGGTYLYYSSTEESYNVKWIQFSGTSAGSAGKSPYTTPGQSGKKYFYRAIKQFDIMEE